MGLTARVMLLVLALATLVACQSAAHVTERDGCSPAVRVLDAYPHDTEAFTQGLLFYKGSLFESTGLYGTSELRQVERDTGRVLKRRQMGGNYFGEGLARAGDRLVQLTWQENTAFVYDLQTFEIVDRYSYDGEGWGLCFDGEFFYRSDGGSSLFIHDPRDFTVIGIRPVTMDARPVDGLNELECVGDTLYANRYMTDEILRIDKHSGIITARIDARGLLSSQERSALPSDAVMNGIAYDAEEDVFYLTGKRWPRLFRVRFLIVGKDGGAPGR